MAPAGQVVGESARRARRSLGSRAADLATWPLCLLALLLPRLPLRWVQALGLALGRIWYHLVPLRRRVALDNLARAFPEVPARQRARIAAGSFSHVATTVLELLWLDEGRGRRLGSIVSVEGFERYEAIRRSGRGVLAVTAHLGNWDLLACSQALRGVPLHVVTKELSSEGLSRLWMERRRETGVRLLPAAGSIRQVLRALRDGEVVALVVDQRTPAGEGGIESPLFGAPVWTTRAPATLAARTGAALLPVVSTRGRDGTHRVRIGPEIRPGRTAAETTAAINRQIERWVRWCPEQWLWIHRRWAP